QDAQDERRAPPLEVEAMGVLEAVALADLEAPALRTLDAQGMVHVEQDLSDVVSLGRVRAGGRGGPRIAVCLRQGRETPQDRGSEGDHGGERGDSHRCRVLLADLPQS